MRIYSVSNSNYNNVNINRTNDISKHTFKGKNFAKILSEFRFNSFDGFYAEKTFKGFRYLMENVSKEPYFQAVKEDAYKELAATDTEDAFFDLLENWYKDYFSDRTLIARDSEGPLIKYTRNKDKASLQFLSNDRCVSIETKDAVVGRNIMGLSYQCSNSSDVNDSAMFQ